MTIRMSGRRSRRYLCGLGMNAETLRNWIRQGMPTTGSMTGFPVRLLAEIRALKRATPSSNSL